ncbi:hypothetical protein [Dokdonella sp.]|uniref:hypothetical protein n=1 Tax=Dokdonella sp. TaxID=2291710 RepID=UPI002F3EEA9F
MRKTALTACAVLMSPALFAAPQRDAASLQQQLEALEARVAALEANDRRLREQADAANASAKAARDELAALQASATAVAVPEPPPAAAATGASANANAFNPAISVILNGSYSTHSKNPDDYVRAGFPVVGEGGPSPRGFSLGESELSFAANIDEKFYGQLTLTAESEHGEDHIGVEEAFIDTTALPEGFNLRLGRFYSDIGYLNSHHAHTDSFFDRPLPYQAFLGNQYGDDGAQLRWLAPTDLYLEVGSEIFRGEHFPSAGAAHGGAGVKTLFAHAGGDVGTENSWLAGVSVLKSSAKGAEDGFSGDSTLYIADATWKWAPQGNFKDGGVTVRGEYFSDHRDGVWNAPPDDGTPLAWRGARRGAYLEGVYRFNRTWDLGYRVDKLWADRQGPFASAFDPYRNTLELAWHNSEFSLLRLQFSRDEPTADTTDNALTLQYQVSLGAHGAHKF